MNQNKHLHHQEKTNLEGSLERITFHSEETGFCVLRVKVKGHKDFITVIGHALSIHPGEYISCKGLWINDKKHGLQFKAEEIQTITPTTIEGIEKYLGSGMVKGIGPHFAKKMVKTFGEEVLNIIEHKPERLLVLDGIGEKRKQQIVLAWAEQKAVRHIMIFLQSYGVGTARAVRIYKTYGEEAIELIQENPYRLALDIKGIGFKTADELGSKLGIPKNALVRAQAGLRHVLHELCEHGHCATPVETLIESSSALLEIEATVIEDALNKELEAGRLVQDLIKNKNCIYPSALYQAEVKVAEHLAALQNGTPLWHPIDTEKALAWAEEKTKRQLSPSQREAIRTVIQSKCSIITGGPGVGKTTLLNTFLQLLQAKKLAIALCAPTGRAAKRLSEATGLEAKTIHRLLTFSPKTFSFKYNANYPLPIDVLIVDEASMLDIILLNHLIKAVPRHAALIFVGDIDQLPSVGSGAVLSDLIASGVITTVRLKEIFRQAASSHIIINAHRVNQGKIPLANQGKNSDFFTLYTKGPEALQETLIQVVADRLPQFYGCHPILDIQVLTPMNRGGLGTRGLNLALQEKLNAKAEPKITRFGNIFSPGDKVIQTSNNYDKEVFNGDIGYIERIQVEDHLIQVNFDQQLKTYDFNELDELQLAYAISIHKSQGSEFPIVIIPVSTQHYTLLARNLLYTGITRGKKLVILVAEKKAVFIAVHNNKAAERLTKLAERLFENFTKTSPAPAVLTA